MDININSKYIVIYIDQIIDSRYNIINNINNLINIGIIIFLLNNEEKKYINHKNILEIYPDNDTEERILNNSCFIIYISYYKSNESIKSAPLYKDGHVISKELGEKILYDKAGSIDGGCMLLEPNKDMYQKFIKFSENTDVRKFNTRPTDDELLLFAFYYNNNINFHYLNATWSCIFWKMENLCSIENSHILNLIITYRTIFNIF